MCQKITIKNFFPYMRKKNREQNQGQLIYRSILNNFWIRSDFEFFSSLGSGSDYFLKAQIRIRISFRDSEKDPVNLQKVS